jgi:hypothetical protein
MGFGGDQVTGDGGLCFPSSGGVPRRGGVVAYRTQKTTPSGLRLPPLRGRGIQGHPHFPAPQGRGWVLGFLFLDRPLPC